MTNLWKRMKSVFPDAPMRIGTVSAVRAADHTSVITLPGGGQLLARGVDVPVGAMAYVRDGVIEGQAPSLPLDEIEI